MREVPICDNENEEILGRGEQEKVNTDSMKWWELLTHSFCLLLSPFVISVTHIDDMTASAPG